MLSTVHCVYDYKMDGATPVKHLGGLRITHYGRLAGREKSWLDLQFDMGFLHFLGMTFSLDCAYEVATDERL